MNCKQGDLAMVVMGGYVSERNVNLGKIVTCLDFVPSMPVRAPNEGIVKSTNVWRVTPPLIAWDESITPFIPDANLRPLRKPGDDERDEMLRPLPKSETVK